MFSFTVINFIILFYLLFLVVSALLVERRVKNKQQLSLVANPYIYSLSMAVWCTSWTYYGSVGIAAHNGMLYLTIYLGATISVFLFPILLKKFILIKEKYRITSITDLIVARYDKSQSLGAISALFVVIGIIPYIAIQVKAIIDSIHILAVGMKTEVSVHSLSNHYIVLLTIFVTILFGLRKLDSTEKHPGMVFILACESLIKLGALLALGFFCTFVLNDGFDSLLDQMPKVVSAQYNFMGATSTQDYFTWCTYIVLSASAILFLPRQFQVAVVENYDKKHIKKAVWLFPLFLFLINLFVLPVAITGLTQGLPLEKADSFVLLLPMAHAQKYLSLFVFLGGFSASIGMIMIETVAVSTIVSNQLLLPLFNKVCPNSNVTKQTLKIRWFIAALIIYMAYFYTWYVGSTYALVSMGLISFVAFSQFAPAILAGLFWKRANKHGAIIGITSGAIVWFYTLIIPAFAKSGMMEAEILTHGPFGISWLRPEHLMGFENLSFLSHSLIWTMFFNVSGLVLGSLFYKQSETEEKTVKDYTELLARKEHQKIIELDYGAIEENIHLLPKMGIFQSALEKYLTHDEAKNSIERIVEELGLKNKQYISIYTLSKLNDQVEKYLAGMVGSSVAFYTLENAHVFNEGERKELADLFANLLAQMRVDPRELTQKLAELQKRQGQLEKDAQTLELAMQKKTKELEEQQELAYQASKLASLGEVAAGIAHEINNPLAIISSSAQIMENLLQKETVDKEKFRSLTTNIKQTVVRASRIVQGMRNIARQSDSDQFETTTIAEMLEDSTNLCLERFKSRGVDLKIFADEATLKASIDVNRTTISQAFINFLNNAFDAVVSKHDRWVELHLDLKQEHLCIKIIDSGHGIPQDIQEKIFQPFFTTKDVGKGTGLGLSLSMSFIKQHNGTVTIDTRNPHTCFVIMLPLKHYV